MINLTLITSSSDAPTTIKIGNDPHHRNPDAVLLEIEQDPCEINHYSAQKMTIRLQPSEVHEFVQALGMTQ